MNRDDIIKLLSCKFYENFADTIALQISTSEINAQILYNLSISHSDLEPAIRKKVGFRSAYVLETIYFNYPYIFSPFKKQFIKDFPYCSNDSAKRHFGKMMTHILQTYRPTIQEAESIAQSAADWIMQPKAKIAVKIWAVEVLKSLRGDIEWIDDNWDDIVDLATSSETPALLVRKRKWRANEGYQ